MTDPQMDTKIPLRVVYPLPPLRVVSPLPTRGRPPPLRVGDPLPYEGKLDGLRTNWGYLRAGLLLQGPPDGVCQAAQFRWCGAAVDSPAAVAAPSKISKSYVPENLIFSEIYVGQN